MNMKQETFRSIFKSSEPNVRVEIGDEIVFIRDDGFEISMSFEQLWNLLIHEDTDGV